MPEYHCPLCDALLMRYVLSFPFYIFSLQELLILTPPFYNLNLKQFLTSFTIQSELSDL